MRVVVAGLMAVMTLLVGCDSATPSFGQPSDLVGSWKLIDLQGFDGAAHTAPDGALTLRFSGGWVANGCGSTPATSASAPCMSSNTSGGAGSSAVVLISPISSLTLCSEKFSPESPAGKSATTN